MQFITPPKIIFGRGSIEELQKEENSVIVSGESVWKNVEKYISKDFPVIIFRRRSRTGEPDEKDVERLTEEIRRIQPSTIIAIGGGSVIDAAKTARIIYEYGLSWEDMYSGKIPPLKTKFIAVETTSGTGTGVSAAAVIKNKEDFKAGIVSPYIVPDVSIYDPNLVDDMPKKVAIYTGMDALTHAIEAYTSNVDNLISDTLALKAIELIFKNLRKAVNGDKEAREKVHYGNMLAGIGFTNSRLGLCHSAAHWIGGRYEIEHGKINAILLPYVIKANERYTPKFENIAQVMGVEDVTLGIVELNREFGIPSKFEFGDDLEFLSEKISTDRLMNFNPRKMSRDEVYRFLQAVEEGRLDEI